MKNPHKLEILPLDVAQSGAAYLATLVDKQGQFKYRFDPEEGKASRGYNVLRHCGTIWAMMDVCDSLQSEEVLDACRRAAIYLQNNFLIFDGDMKHACVMEKNAIKLGGNALAIIALLSVNKNLDDDLLQAIILRLGDFMLDQQDSDGDFIHKRFFKSGKISQFRSLYYTGEALLALMKLHEITGEKRFLDAVLKCEDLLCPQDYGVAEQSHWMLYSLEALLKVDNSPKYYLHAEKIARHIIDNPDYKSWGRSTPTACRSEGLLAFLRIQPPASQKADDNLRQKCLEAVKENLALQLSFRRPEGSFIRGGDDHRQTEVRIDYIQHNISSYLHYSRMNLQD